MGQQFGDTTLTKVFVGGLAWETQKDALREHFEKYGEILEAVIISDKATGRSKGYGFVTFKQAEAAKKACEDATPVISGRRANCNLASLGAKRGGLRPSPPSATAPLPSEGHHQPPWMAVGARAVSSGPPAAQWYYRHPSVTPPPPSQFHLHHGLLPLYASTAAYGYAPDSTPQSYENYRTSIVLPQLHDRLGLQCAKDTSRDSSLVIQHKEEWLLPMGCCQCTTPSTTSTTINLRAWESLPTSSLPPPALPLVRWPPFPPSSPSLLPSLLPVQWDKSKEGAKRFRKRGPETACTSDEGVLSLLPLGLGIL
ncbi:RNA recognition motif containing protein [Musa troglodytarum]|uniref:RNA recognition motif containing protein n=1 Tax=Musa troglodytarum TaxID=320322 RepID=A0A9E7JEU4_9LILI|nr:RNA recognition motif containing protein [Musa troglodytarum]